MSHATVRPKGQLTLPADVRAALHVTEGDVVEFELTEDGTVVLHGMKMIRADQAWFWTESWQAGERDADADLAAGHGTVYPDGESFLASLER